MKRTNLDYITYLRLLNAIFTILLLAIALVMAFVEGFWVKALAVTLCIVLVVVMHVLYRCPMCGKGLDPRRDLREYPFCPACGGDLRGHKL